MKRFFKFFPIALLFVCLGICVAVAGATLYVSSDTAELKSESSSSSDTLAELSRGAVLTELATEGRWLKVTTKDGRTGWIYRGKVSAEEPEMEDTGDDGAGAGSLLGGLSGSDINADAADSSRSIRGLSPEAKEYAQATGTPKQSQDALDSVISRTVKDDAIDGFLKQGKIGEYAD
ncbi:MAG: SH3 domain-containing protein [Desulfobacterales bacterium CG23_combo_of_CG06-09_8_20_14_all_51_8]|nr:MAG: SH3 domain-containing protein [Desulfobacterales bacterium CG23_combo_of_CG06-09_8_20_14_all_51_8]